MRYAAPVAADRVVDGFVLSLAYATSVDWLRNVLTAGEATITTSGETNHVVEPEIIDAAKVSTELLSRRRWRPSRGWASTSSSNSN